MVHSRTLLSLAGILSLATASPVSLVKRNPVWEGGYYNPTSNGGQWLTVSQRSPTWPLVRRAKVAMKTPRVRPSLTVPSVQLARDTYPPGLGEPINVVISNESDGLLMTDDGFFDFCESINFSGECLGQTGGLRQAANLGDGKGMSTSCYVRLVLLSPPAY